jgi:hypothetical protein
LPDPGRRGGKPATNRFSYGAAWITSKCQTAGSTLSYTTGFLDWALCCPWIFLVTAGKKSLNSSRSLALLPYPYVFSIHHNISISFKDINDAEIKIQSLNTRIVWKNDLVLHSSP